jgi:surface polysaccharide O-acyltransferase-like enzyme
MHVTQTLEPGTKQARAAVGAVPASAVPLSEAVTAPRRPSAERLANVERLRIVAMWEIVTFHVGGAVGLDEYRLPLVGGLGLPVFLLLNNAFNCTLAERRGTRAFLDAKVSRLLLPWLVWSAIYAAVVAAERLRHHEPIAEAFLSWRTLLGGTYTHLWFVPFALFGSLAIAAAQAWTKTVSHRSMAAWSLALGAVVVVIDAIILEHSGSDWPVSQWLFALPSPLLGFALGRVLLADDRKLSRRVAALLVGVAGLVVAGSWLAPMGDLARRYAVSMALVALFFSWPGTLDALSRRLTPLLFGIYLTHPLILRSYQAAHLPPMPPALLGVLLFFSAALLVELLRRTPLRSLV